jgi:dTDP-4-dehydrorhamnose reductase
MDRTTVLVLGGTGMLGHTLFEHLSERPDLDVHATVRDAGPLSARRPPDRQASIHAGIDATRVDHLRQVVAEVRPAVLLNAIGIVKQVPAASDPLASTEINALFPHRVARLCALAGIRLIHIGTDCVFSGSTGSYTEDDPPDPVDLYGRTKLLGEPLLGETPLGAGAPWALTLRTSLIGHELRSGHGLLEWMLRQVGPTTGYRRAIFSGLTTLELARVVADVVLPQPGLSGLYHVSSAPISKLDLLELIARRYEREIEIIASDEPVIDRSLDSTRFQAATGYRPPSWPELVDAMYDDAIVRYPARLGGAARLAGVARLSAAR